MFCSLTRSKSWLYLIAGADCLVTIFSVFIITSVAVRVHKRMNDAFTQSHTSFADNPKMIIKLPHCRASTLDVARILFAMVICTKDRSEVKGGLALYTSY